MNLMSSTLKVDESGKPFHEQQADQIEKFRAAWKAAGHEREPRVSVSRSIMPIVTDEDRAYFGYERNGEDSFGFIDNFKGVFGRSYAAEPDVLDRGAGQGLGDRRGGHPAAHRAEPARRRLQRPPARVDPEVRRPGSRLALISSAHNATGQALPTTGQAVRSYGEPVRSYGEPVRSYGEPVRSYGEPVRSYAWQAEP